MSNAVRLTFIHKNEEIHALTADNAARRRYSIFAEKERRKMSDGLAQLDPNQLLLDIERVSLNLGDIAPFARFEGPFGVFRCDAPHLEQASIDENVPTIGEGCLDIDELLRPPDSCIIDEDVLRLDDIEALCTFDPFAAPQIAQSNQLDQKEDTPCTNLLLPCAMNALAELTMGGTPTDARLALLNGLLATSALHMEAYFNITEGSLMLCGETYIRRAKHYIENLTNAFMLAGDPDNRMSYLRRAERFICANGFKKTVLSPKRRTLHHCYAYMRIMAETTSVSATSVWLNEMILGSERCLEGIGFRVLTWISFSDDAIAKEKDTRMAQRDLHLAIPGHWGSTLFPTLYGVSETFLMLLSQVIRLANERDLTTSQQSVPSCVLTLQEFLLRAKTLEREIRRLLVSCHGDNESSIRGKDATVRAMYTALLVFLYRRVHDVDARLVQQEVQSIQGYLWQIQQESISMENQTIALLWPAFIAACEALYPESQAYFSLWFDTMFKATGLVSIALAKNITEAVWARRRNLGPLGASSFSWPDVLR
ncbi:hypothetical protein BBP40_010132, partial [Aspergillus hancockii]